VITPDLHLVDDIAESEKQIGRKGDNAPEEIEEGSPAAFCEDESSYKVGLTEPILQSGEVATQQPQPPDDAGNPRPPEDETLEVELEEEE
jgi:hypothetical protein